MAKIVKKKAELQPAVLAHEFYDSDEQLFISNVEGVKKCKYVIKSTIRDMYNCWIFYQDEPHPRGSNYFGIYNDVNKTPWVFDAKPWVHNKEFYGILQPDGKVMYSYYRHNYRTNKWKDMIDGGTDYFRYSLGKGSRSRPVTFVIKDGEPYINLK